MNCIQLLFRACLSVDQSRFAAAVGIRGRIAKTMFEFGARIPTMEFGHDIGMWDRAIEPPSA